MWRASRFPSAARVNHFAPTVKGDMNTEHIEGDGTKMQLYVRSMGKLLAVTALFDSDDSANAYCETHRDEGVVATGAGLVFLANLYDRGTRAELPINGDKTRLFIENAALRETLDALYNETAGGGTDSPWIKTSKGKGKRQARKQFAPAVKEDMNKQEQKTREEEIYLWKTTGGNMTWARWCSSHDVPDAQPEAAAVKGET